MCKRVIRSCLPLLLLLSAACTGNPTTNAVTMREVVNELGGASYRNHHVEARGEERRETSSWETYDRSEAIRSQRYVEGESFFKKSTTHTYSSPSGREYPGFEVVTIFQETKVTVTQIHDLRSLGCNPSSWSWIRSSLGNGCKVRTKFGGSVGTKQKSIRSRH